MAPSAISAKPGQFEASSNPAPGSLGSRVSRAKTTGARFPLGRPRQTGGAARSNLSLSRPRQREGAARSSTPLITSSAPSKILHMLPSSVAGHHSPYTLPSEQLWLSLLASRSFVCVRQGAGQSPGRRECSVGIRPLVCCRHSVGLPGILDDRLLKVRSCAAALHKANLAGRKLSWTGTVID